MLVQSEPHNGSSRAAATALPSSMILTVTRACNLRCVYCPTAKDGWPSLSQDDVLQAVGLFADHFTSRQRPGDIKLFGGEPLLVPDVVRTAVDAAQARPEVRRIYLSTNGLGLDPDWLRWLAGRKKLILTVSMDGTAADHRRLRRGLPGVADSYSHVCSMLPQLAVAPRVVVTQTIAPSTAARCADNFLHLWDLGFRRFNFLPGYFVPWRAQQLEDLTAGFAEIARHIQQQWALGQRVYVRNIFTWAPTPFFNTGLVVDADRSIHPSNVGLSGQLDGLRGQTQVGSLDDPPTVAALRVAAERVPALLDAALSQRVRSSTQAADAALTAFVAALTPAWLAHKHARKG